LQGTDFFIFLSEIANLQLMFKIYKLLLTAITVLTTCCLVTNSKAALAGCSDAGVATSSEDSVCYNASVTLNLAGYTGTIQWQSYNGSQWVDESAAGFNTDAYNVMLAAGTKFRAIVTQSPCAPDTSNEVEIIVGVIPVPTANAVSRCGPGMVTLQGSGSGSLQWYTVASGGTAIATGNSPSVFIAASTTLYVEDFTSSGSGGTASPLLVSEVNLGGTDDLEIQNVSSVPLDVTGWKVAISDSYTDINLVNANVQNLSGILQPGDILTWTDAAAAVNYWGSNMFWNPGAFPTFTGWAMIIDDQNTVRDFVVWAWPSANIQAMNTNVAGIPVTVNNLWNGDGIDASVVAATDGLSRIGNIDTDSSADFAVTPLSIAVTNSGMTIPFSGFGCTSPRIPVSVTISPSDAISINATATDLCLSGSATLTATSNNSGYNYSWSPSTGLNTTTGATVTATPLLTTTYVVTGDDGTCANVDTVTITVGAPTVAGTASTFQDTICLGKNTDLILTGSTGTIQWQSWNGSMWVNQSGPNSNTSVYNVAPVVNTTYRAYVTSGSCPPDSSNQQDIIVLTATDPVTSDTTICDPGTVTLNASGNGTLTWYPSSTGGLAVNTGNSYTFNANQTVTYYVESFTGTEYSIGPVTSAIGNQSSTLPNNTGMVFDVLRPVTIDLVYVYPNQTGTVTVNLRQTAGGPVLATYTQAVIAFSGKTALPVNFSVPVGTGYRMELESGSVSCQQNSTGATYPYTVPNGPLAITGYCNPNFGTGTIYLYLYDWLVTEGCKSARIPSTVTVVNLAIPTITQNFNTLTSSSATGNQWYFNGNIIPGATGQTLNITQTGNYTVVVTDSGCIATSSVFTVITIGLEDISTASVNIYPVPANQWLYINSGENQNISTIDIVDITGRKIYSEAIDMEQMGNNILKISVSDFEAGIYLLTLGGENYFAVKSFIIQR
jgi:hypothetical protein